MREERIMKEPGRMPIYTVSALRYSGVLVDVILAYLCAFFSSETFLVRISSGWIISVAAQGLRFYVGLCWMTIDTSLGNTRSGSSHCITFSLLKKHPSHLN